ncbi:MAG: hypothetical protein QF489_03215 [Planctomycetota bacterium]|jgi:hypothetical protein|nr:hypothetical protein [Planctomycetota bacterium]
MILLQRIAWLALGLLVLVGVAHAPLHAAPDHFGEECSQFALCSGAITLLVCAAVVVVSRNASLRQPRRLAPIEVPCTPARFSHGSRGPPLW